MKNTHHTPGPWTYTGSDGWIRAEKPAHGSPHAGMHVADIRGWGYLTGGGSAKLGEDEAEAIQLANGRLVAAAPDMLEALRALLPEGWGKDETMDHMPGVKLARLAIAKAEGRS